MNKYIKEHYDVKTDSLEWIPLKSSAYFNKEIRKNQAEMEMIDSYIESMEIMYIGIKNELREGMCILRTYSLCVPYLYICRHIIELIIKKSIEGKLQETKNGHSIKTLWGECKRLNKDKNLNNYNQLIEAIDSLDNNGEKFRYAKDKEGNEFDNKPLFLNVGLIKTDIYKLKKELF